MSVMLLSENPAMLSGDTAEVSPRLTGPGPEVEVEVEVDDTLARGAGVMKELPIEATRASTATFIVRAFDMPAAVS